MKKSRSKDSKIYKGDLYIVKNGIIFRNKYIECKNSDEFAARMFSGEFRNV